MLIAVLNRFLCLLVHPFQPIRHWEVGAKLGPCKPLRNAGANMPGGVGFQQHHISQLKKVAFVSSYNHLLVTLLSQTGLRRRAVAWLRTECVFDHENGCVRSIGMAVEKHLYVRHFPIGPEPYKVRRHVYEAKLSHVLESRVFDEIREEMFASPEWQQQLGASVRKCVQRYLVRDSGNPN